MEEPPSPAVLSSLAHALEDLQRRVADAAQASLDGGLDHQAGELFEVERALLQAGRRLARLRR